LHRRPDTHSEAGRAEGEHRTRTGSFVPGEARRAQPGPKEAIPALPTSPRRKSCSCRRALFTRQLCRVPPSPARTLCPAQRCGACCVGPEPAADGGRSALSFQLCFVCGNSGATIICAESGCHRSFHLPCASEGQCVTLYIGKFR